MREHDGRRIFGERKLDDLARMNTGAVDRAAKKFDVLDQPLTFIQKEYAKHFILEDSEFDRQEVLNELRRGQLCSTAHLTTHNIPCRLQDFFIRSGPRAALVILHPQLLVRHGRAPWIWARLPGVPSNTPRAAVQTRAAARLAEHALGRAQGLDDEHDVLRFMIDRAATPASTALPFFAFRSGCHRYA